MSQKGNSIINASNFTIIMGAKLGTGLWVHWIYGQILCGILLYVTLTAADKMQAVSVLLSSPHAAVLSLIYKVYFSYNVGGWSWASSGKKNNNTFLTKISEKHSSVRNSST